MGKRRSVCLAVLVASITQGFGVSVMAEESTYGGGETRAAAEQKIPSGRAEAPAKSTEKSEPPPAFDPQEFGVTNTKQKALDAPVVKTNPNDENIDYTPLLRKVDLLELPKAYRHPALGPDGYRPNNIAFSVGGRTPGVGAILDYSFNRLGGGISASYRSVAGFIQEKNNPTLRGTGQVYTNGFVFYDLIPFDVTPFVLVGLEFATNTPYSFNVIAGIGVRARVWKSMIVALEYTRHETSKLSFPGGSVGYAF